MAGGKISPRQKMINMMYLVLTAMLALNVSAEILSAFETIKKKLNESAQAAEYSAEGAKSVMQQKIDQELKAGQKQHELIKDSLTEIHSRTEDMIKFIDGLDSMLMNIPGVMDPKTKEVARKDESELNFQFFMGKGAAAEANGGRGSGQGKSLRDSIDRYSKWLADIYNVNRPDSTLWKDVLIKDPEASKGHEGDGVKKSWERFNFEGPIVANRAMLEAMKQDIYQKENKLFNAYAARLGLKIEETKQVIQQEVQKKIDVKLDVEGAELISAPVSSIVPAGLQFKTNLYVGMKMKEPVRFSSSSGTITPTEGGVGAVLTIPASGNFPAGKSEMEQSYSVTTSVKNIKGTSEELKYNGKFIIRKPEIVVTSATIQNLYRECGNMINIDVPALGELYNPVCTASEAEITPSKESKKKFLIVPRGKKCVVGVSSVTNGQTMKIGDVVYNVIDPPKPSLQLLVAGQMASAQTKVGKGTMVKLKVVPDPEFKSLLPMDARYEVSVVDVYKQCGLGPPTKAGSANLAGRDASGEGLDFPIPGDAFQCPSGSKIYFEVKEVVRKNFQSKKVVDDRFTLYERNISVTTK